MKAIDAKSFNPYTIDSIQPINNLLSKIILARAKRAFLVKEMLMKICSRCGKKIRQGETCTCYSRHQEYDKFQRDKTKATFYKSKSWQVLSKCVKMRANGLDEYMLSKGQIMKGSIAHHIQTIDERPDLKLSLDNLIYVSSGTHNAIHAEYDKGMETKKQMQLELQRIRGQQMA